MKPGRVDALVDAAYGVMIIVAVVLMVAVGGTTGLAFGLGVLISYGIHVIWKMARFDPEWMTREVEETIERTVGKEVEEAVEGTVEDTVEEAVEDAVEGTVVSPEGEEETESTTEGEN
jgi:hypothetical protein